MTGPDSHQAPSSAQISVYVRRWRSAPGGLKSCFPKPNGSSVKVSALFVSVRPLKEHTEENWSTGLEGVAYNYRIPSGVLWILCHALFPSASENICSYSYFSTLKISLRDPHLKATSSVKIWDVLYKCSDELCCVTWCELAEPRPSNSESASKKWQVTFFPPVENIKFPIQMNGMRNEIRIKHGTG